MNTLNRSASYLIAIACSVSFIGAKSAQAAITDHGIYVTDTATNLDWLKFNNTVGLTLNEALSLFASTGWQVATGTQVQSFEMNFGWVADTPFQNVVTANAGLTERMGSVIGFTFTPGYELVIAATIADPWGGPGTNWATLSDYYYSGFRNDYVATHADQWGPDFATNSRGTWMVRAVPEPESFALMAIGLGAVGASVRRLRKDR